MNKTKKFIILLLVSFTSVSLGWQANNFYNSKINELIADDLRFDEQEATILAIKKVLPAVVSIIVYDYADFIALDVPSGSKEILKYRKQMIKGTGFLISTDGYILTNKHVVEAAKEETGEYRIILNTGKEYYAQLIDKDSFNDLAVLKIFDKDLPVVELGDSDSLQTGASVIAIGNALGRYENTVTKGIISGLGRSLIASDQTGNAESLDNLLQTDAKINVGNSGGPLIDLSGKVVGVNTAIEQAGSAIGFAIPINDAKIVIRSIKERGLIVRPRLGVSYRMLTPEIARDNNLTRDSGAWLTTDSEEIPAVLPDSPAAEAGLGTGDIIFEVNAIKIEGKNTLLSVIQRYKPGDKIGLKVQRGDRVIMRVVTLDEFK
jgi:serine protease Do